ncbi:MAG: diaminopimelate epimerase [Eubacterium sp.]
MKFTKMHGCGNNYIYINGFSERVTEPQKLAVEMSDVRFGIGSDGLIIINPSDVADFKMSMYNMDGSEGKMCGNGIRCVAKYVYDYGLTKRTTITVETLSGIKTLELNVRDGKTDTVKVDMGQPILEPANIPVISDKEKVISESITILGKEYLMTCVSMGNPHAVIFDNNIDKLDLPKIGPYFENNEVFPDRINTEFVNVISRKEIEMRVWERGSGETWACGTGACASVVACILNGFTEDDVKVHLRGGDLLINYDRDKNTVYMTGPAAIICDGEWKPEERG